MTRCSDNRERVRLGPRDYCAIIALAVVMLGGADWRLRSVQDALADQRRDHAVFAAQIHGHITEMSRRLERLERANEPH